MASGKRFLTRGALAVGFILGTRVLSSASGSVFADEPKSKGSGSSITYTITDLGTHGKPVTCVAFSPDGKTLASSSYNQTIIKLWDVQSAKLRSTLTGHPGGVGCVTYSPDGKVLASAGGDSIRLWDMDKLKHVESFQTRNGFAVNMAFRPDGKTLAAVLSNGLIQIWDVPTKEETATLWGLGRIEGQPSGGAVGGMACAIAPDGKKVVFMQPGFKLFRIVDLDDPKLPRLEKKEERNRKGGGVGLAGSPSRGAWSPNGETIVQPYFEYRPRSPMELWDARTEKHIRNIDGFGVLVAFTPDGKLLASAGYKEPLDSKKKGPHDWTIKLWEVGTGKEVATLMDHGKTVGAIAFDPDGKRLAAGLDRTVKIWDLDLRK